MEPQRRLVRVAVPGPRPRSLEGEGHLSLAVSTFDRILDELAETDVRA